MHVLHSEQSLQNESRMKSCVHTSASSIFENTQQTAIKLLLVVCNESCIERSFDSHGSNLAFIHIHTPQIEILNFLKNGSLFGKPFYEQQVQSSYLIRYTFW
jgi:hypothetical protein